MVKQVLINAGFVEGETFKETRFLKAPRDTYAVYMDSFDARGSDDANRVKDHDYTIELYSYKPDPAAEKAIEDGLNALALPFFKEERYWIEEEQLYQIIYTFSYVEK